MKKNIRNNQSGQALIELIIFLPIMFTLYSMIAGFANAINGSINQQKVTRGYFYYRLNNNSTAPKPDERSHTNWSIFGLYFFGWADKVVNEQPVANCYKLSIPLNPAPTDVCENAYTEATTQFIRVGTAYGICGATYQSRGNLAVPMPDDLGASFQQVTDVSSCLIKGL